MDQLVPGRECGGCTLCCTVLLVDTPEIQKEAGATCRHCVKGCAIHESRPPVCRDYFCAWRRMEIFGPEWRPDRSGVLAEIEPADIPAELSLRTGISLMLTGQPRKIIRQKYFQDFINWGVMNGVPLFLALPGPSGHQAAKLILNTEAMRAAVANGHVKDALETALARISRHGFPRHTMRHSGNDTGI